MSSKLRIKLGPIEIEFEGDESFMKQELPDLISAVSHLHKESGLEIPEGVVDDADSSTDSTLRLTTSTIAGRLNAKKGGDLLTAAAAKLSLVDSLPHYTRKDLLREMKSATHYYNKNYGSNLGGYIKTLIGERCLSEVSTGNYALTADELKRLKGKL